MWKRYLSPTPSNVARLLIGAKTILMGIAGTVFMTGKVEIAFYIAVATGVLNEAAAFLSANPKENGDDAGTGTEAK